MKHFERFAKITKIDDEERMVFGYASTPDLDSDGEIIKLSAMEKALPSYMQFPTLREMHQPKAAGKTIEASIRSGKQKGLYIGAKVVSDEAWKLVKEGVYKAFSIGGNVKKRVGNIIEELELVEISLVDSPANKNAVIDLWKANKLSKDAETAYSMANLMITVKSIIEYYDYLGKPTKKLNKILEMIKVLLSEEAGEPEKSSQVLTTKQKIEALEKMDFSDNEVADGLRRGVIALMKNKKLKKSEEELKEDQVKTDEEVTPTDVEVKTEETDETQETEEVEETEETEVEEEKESSAEVTLRKLTSAVEKVNKSLGVEDETETVEKMDISKQIGGLVESIEKFADVMVDFNERLKKVEATPAQTKSKTVLALKSDTQDAEKTQEATPELERINNRLEELDKIYDQIGASKFSKLHQNEVAKLQSEKDLLVLAS